MSTQESDGIDEALQGVTQVALTAAARTGEVLARAREEQMRQAQARSEQAVRELTERLTAEREAARAALAPVSRAEWWDSATGDEVAKAYATAKAWSDVDPAAAQAEQRIVDEVRTRYGVDAAGGESPDQGPPVNGRIDAARDGAQAQLVMADADAVDRAQAAVDRAQTAVVEAQDVSVGLTEGAEPAYDSAARREVMAHALDDVENRVAVDARLRSDVAQGRPATDAVASGPGKAPKARRTKGNPTNARTVQRGGRAR